MVAGVPSCGVLTVTSLAMYESTIYRTEKQEPAAPCCYRRGDCVYFPVDVPVFVLSCGTLAISMPFYAGYQCAFHDKTLSEGPFY